MKNLILVLIALTSTTAFAQTQSIAQNTEAMDLVNVLLMKQTQDCIKSTGFEGIESLISGRNVTISKDDGATNFSILIDQFGILPTDGVKLVNTYTLNINVKKLPSRAGAYFEMVCTYLKN